MMNAGFYMLDSIRIRHAGLRWPIRDIYFSLNLFNIFLLFTVEYMFSSE